MFGQKTINILAECRLDAEKPGVEPAGRAFHRAYSRIRKIDGRPLTAKIGPRTCLV
jgi:hypothetical protein